MNFANECKYAAGGGGGGGFNCSVTAFVSVWF